MLDYEIKQILYNGKKNVLWGAGQNGVRTLFALASIGIPVEMFCDADSKKQRIHILNKEVKMPEEAFENRLEYNFVITPANMESRREIIDKLEEWGVNDYLVWDDIERIIAFNAPNIKVSFRGLYRIIQDSYSKKFIIYGTGREASSLQQLLEMLDVKIAYFIDDVESAYKRHDSEVRPVYDLLYEKEGTFKVLVTLGKKENMQMLDGLGLTMGRDYSLYEIYTTAIARKHILDPHLGFSFQPKRNSDVMSGITELGDGEFVIALLGGSTTDGETYSYKSWGELLYEKLIRAGYSVKILNGGCGGYHTPQELIKLVRDIIPLAPDVVIDYTGVNDSIVEGDYPFVHEYQKKLVSYMAEEVKYDDSFRRTDNKYTLGVKSDRTNDQMFIDNIRIMSSICREYEIVYKAFLQPCLAAKKGELSDYGYELMLHLSFDQRGWKSFDNTKKFYEKVRGPLAGYAEDITSLFDENDDVYLDWCHVSEQGNEIIAQYMYEHLVDEGIVKK